MKLPTFERMRTLALLHRFFRTALLVGRMPSLLGREILPSAASATAASGFENAIVFVCDVERCLACLDPSDRQLLACCVFENHTEWEAARRFRRTQSVISWRLSVLLDRLHAEFIRRGLLPPIPAVLHHKGKPAVAPQQKVAETNLVNVKVAETNLVDVKASSRRTGRGLRRNNEEKKHSQT